jgi:hypothetical protein
MEQNELFETGNAGLNAEKKDYHMVVVGEIDHLTKTHATITYHAGANIQTVEIDRKDFGASGAIGIEHPDAETHGTRAFSFKQCVCPGCGNREIKDCAEGQQARKVRVVIEDAEGEETVKVHNCPSCDGKGHVSEWADGLSPTIDAEWQDIHHVLEQGFAPDHAVPTFEFMLKGGRDTISSQWDVEITPVPMGAMKDGQFHVDGKYISRTNTDGVKVQEFVADLIQHYNQQYATPSMPLGLKIGRPKTGQYATRQHRDVIPMFKAWADSRGLKNNVYGMNHGQDAILDIEISANGDRQEVINNIRSEGRTVGDDGRPVALSKDPRGVVSFGVQIRSSFDGAIQMVAIAQRVVCLNGMVGTRSEVLLSLQHKHGPMALLELPNLTEKIMQCALSMYNEASSVEAMDYIELTVEDFERALVIANERGLMPFPTLSTRDAGRLGGGQVFRNAIKGWAQPGAEYVLVGPEYNGTPNTLYHLYNIFNGIATHRPVAHDVHGRVTGGKAISVDQTQKQMRDFHQLCRDIQEDAFGAYKAHYGNEPANGADLNAFVEEFGIPMLEAVEANENGHYLPIINSRVNDDGEYNELQLTSRYQAPLVA